MVEQLVGEVVGKYDVELDLADKVVEGLTEPRVWRAGRGSRVVE